MLGLAASYRGTMQQAITKVKTYNLLIFTFPYIPISCLAKATWYADLLMIFVLFASEICLCCLLFQLHIFASKLFFSILWRKISILLYVIFCILIDKFKLFLLLYSGIMFVTFSQCLFFLSFLQVHHICCEWAAPN